MFHRNLGSLPLPPRYRAKLDDNGYKTVRDICDVQPLELARDLGVSPQEALDLWRLVATPPGQLHQRHPRQSPRGQGQSGDGSCERLPVACAGVGVGAAAGRARTSSDGGVGWQARGTTTSGGNGGGGGGGSSSSNNSSTASSTTVAATSTDGASTDGASSVRTPATPRAATDNPPTSAAAATPGGSPGSGAGRGGRGRRRVARAGSGSAGQPSHSHPLSHPHVHTALDMFARKRAARGVVSFCRDLDKLLGDGHGFPCGEVTEVCGQPGIGKTQLGIQVAVDALIPKPFGGVGGAAVYIDTEGSFVVERVRQMAGALVAELRRKAHVSAGGLGDLGSHGGSGGGGGGGGGGGSRTSQEQGGNMRPGRGATKSSTTTAATAIAAGVAATATARPSLAEKQAQALRGFDEEHVLRNLYYFRVYSHVEQVGVVNGLHAFLEAHPEIRVVVVDSVSAHFRQHFDDMAQRTRLLAAMGQKLHLCASRHSVAVVLTNQVTTKLSSAALNSRRSSSFAASSSASRGGGQSRAVLVPALGASWGHACTNRLILRWAHPQEHRHLQLQQQAPHARQLGVRIAQLTKSATRQPGEALFRVVAAGVRDVWVGGGSGGSTHGRGHGGGDGDGDGLGAEQGRGGKRGDVARGRARGTTGGGGDGSVGESATVGAKTGGGVAKKPRRGP